AEPGPGSHAAVGGTARLRSTRTGRKPAAAPRRPEGGQYEGRAAHGLAGGARRLCRLGARPGGQPEAAAVECVRAASTLTHALRGRCDRMPASPLTAGIRGV